MERRTAGRLHPRTSAARHRRIRRRRNISHEGPETRDRRQAPWRTVRARPRPRSWQPHE